MRRFFILATAALAASVALTNSCVQETGSESTDPTLVCFQASFEDAGTKTSYAGSGKVDWSEGDVIRYYMAKNGTVGEHTVPQAGHKTDINAAVAPGSSFFVAAYGGESVSSNTSTSFTLKGAVKAEQSGTFGDAHVAACRTGDVSGATPLSFYNLTSLVSFSVSRTDIAYVIFTAIGGEALHGNGTLNVSFSQDDTPSASFGSSTGSCIRIDLEGPGVYYIATLPTTLSQGFRLEYYSSNNVLIGHTDAPTSQTLARNGLLRLGPLERHIESETPTGGDESGMYLGIIGFNQMLYRYPIGHLDEDSKSGFTAFVDELPSKDGTLLYYSVDEAVNSLLAADFPSDLYSVSMVTFTDGLDQGSMMMTTLYESDEDYLEAIGKRVAEEKVSGLPISAYSIGLRGSDVTDVNKFRSNLKALASNDANAFEASSMSAVNSKFQDIAEKVNGSTYTYSLSLTIPGPSNGTRIRFTLDNVSFASYSKTYIEGVFNLKNRSLTDVVYYGLTSTTGSTVQGTVDGIFVTFSFEGLQTSDNSFIQRGNIKQWNYVASSSSWQKNSEFSPAQNSTIGHYKRSAVVMLVLDCSSSLGSQFSTMKGSAKSFINTLAEAADDKYSVASVTLDKTEMTLLLGGSATLYATILPATALEKGLVWTSSDESVATVDQSGKVTAVGLGKSSITVTTVDGAKTATCEVTVNQLAQSLTLDKTSMDIYVGDEPTVLTATVYPDDHVGKSLTWTSSNKSVATVDEYGKVTAVTNGTATITVKTSDGSGLSATCSVKVYRHVESVSLNKTEMTLYVGNSSTLTATVLPSTSNKSVTWTSCDESVATVDQSGKVTAVGPGQATITVTTVDGAKTATCEVTVKQFAQSISLDKTSLEMYVGDEPITLVATILPDNTSDKSVTWTSSNSSVATVDSDGKVTAVSKGSTKITVKATDGSNVSAACMVTVKTIRTDTNGREAVDLGLPSGLKWATMNVGATKPEEHGEYFAWGETQPKTDYSWSTYKFELGPDYDGPFSKYVTKSSYGSVDNKTVLDPEDDAAHVNWGGSWRMPTFEECEELINKCTWTWTTQNGVNGRLVTGPNGKSIFLPAAGYRVDTNLRNAGPWGSCWSSSLNTDIPFTACDVRFGSGDVYRHYNHRYFGHSVRPVTE